MTYASAYCVASELVGMLNPFCERLEIAGSMRRQKDDGIKDIEIVAIPKTEGIEEGLFGDVTGELNLLLEELNRLVVTGEIQKRLDETGRPCWGERHQRAVYEGAAVDIFQVLPPAQWGVIFALRTGPALFSKRLVTARSYGGLMPFGMQVKDGALWRQGVIVPTPEEVDFLNALGLDYIEPKERAE